VSLEPVAKGAPADAEELRGTYHIPVCPSKCLLDEFALDLLEAKAPLWKADPQMVPVRDVGRGLQLGRQMLRHDLVALFKDENPLYHVAEFPDIAWPGIGF